MQVFLLRKVRKLDLYGFYSDFIICLILYAILRFLGCLGIASVVSKTIGSGKALKGP